MRCKSKINNDENSKRYFIKSRESDAESICDLVNAKAYDKSHATKL
jgi:hypothetical protein